MSKGGAIESKIRKPDDAVAAERRAIQRVLPDLEPGIQAYLAAIAPGYTDQARAL
jgi:hypothetical protein